MKCQVFKCFKKNKFNLLLILFFISTPLIGIAKTIIYNKYLDKGFIPLVLRFFLLFF